MSLPDLYLTIQRHAHDSHKMTYPDLRGYTAVESRGNFPLPVVLRELFVQQGNSHQSISNSRALAAGSRLGERQRHSVGPTGGMTAI